MKTQTTQFLSQILRQPLDDHSNVEESVLFELIADFVNGKLDVATAADVKHLIETDSEFAEQHANYLRTQHFLESEEGQAYAGSVDASVRAAVQALANATTPALVLLPSVPAQQQTLAPKLAALSSLFTQGFRSLPLRAAASEASAGEKVLWEHEDDSGKQQILEDRFGRYFLSVTTRDEEIAKAVAEVRLVEPKPVLTFKKLLPGLFAGRVEVSREFAQQVASGEMGFDLDAPGTTNQG